MADDKKDPKFSPYPDHPMCRCTLYGLDDLTVAQLNAIAKEIDSMFMEDLKHLNPGNMNHYYETLEGHLERRH